MALTRQNNGSGPTNIMQASWWNDYMDLLTGVMTDQPVNINNGLSANVFISDYTNAQGYWILDQSGVAQRVMHVHTDNDLHIIPFATNNKLRITKNSYAYDIAVFDASGATGVTTLNGALTITGAFTTNSITSAGAIVGGTHTITGDVNMSGNLNFTAGNSGSVKNPTGGVLLCSAGGSAAVQFATNGSATYTGYVDLNGFHLNRGTYNMSPGSLGAIVMAKTGTGPALNVNHTLNTTPACAMVCVTGSAGIGTATIYGVNSTQFSIAVSSTNPAISWTAFFMA